MKTRRIYLYKYFIISLVFSGCKKDNVDIQTVVMPSSEYTFDLRVSGENIAQANARINISTYEYFLDLAPIGIPDYDNVINLSLLGNNFGPVTLPIVRWPVNGEPSFKHTAKTYIGGNIGLGNITAEKANDPMYASTWLKIEVLANKKIIQVIELRPTNSSSATFNPGLVFPITIDAGKL